MKVGFDYIGKPSEGLIRVKKGIYPNYKCGFINSSNEIVIPLIYANVRNFSEGLAAVRCGNWTSEKWGFINNAGELVIPCIYNNPCPFYGGMAKVQYNNEWFFIDKTGNRIISLKEYDGSSRFCNGFAKVWKVNPNNSSDTVIFTIDTLGKIIQPQTAPNEPSHNKAIEQFFDFLDNKLSSSNG
ncbi:MAG: WG repeat-containing protein [Bacteroidales bacterium]